MAKYSTSEMMVVAAAREIKDGDTVLVGIGMPNLAANLAKRTHASGMKMIYESGTIGSEPRRLPLSIGDPCLVSGAQSVVPMFEGFAFYLQKNLIDVGFIGGAQIDKYGNVNSTVVGDYWQPKVRLPGSGGACDIVSLAKRTIILTSHEKRRFPEKVDFITSPGHVSEKGGRKDLGIPGGGPVAVITNLGIIRFNNSGEAYLDSVHPGVKIEKIKEKTGWELKISHDLKTTDDPTDEELRILREELDPENIYLGR